MQTDVQTIVAGAGVVGLAIAREFAHAGNDVLILEAQNQFGSEISARNSEVIHAGIYYPVNSLKARLCVQGKAMLYDYCKTHSIEHKQVGKIIVATAEEQHETLGEICKKAAANGVNDLRTINGDDVAALEPAIHATAGIHSPSTGIVDSHGLMLSFLGEAESHGAMLAYNSRVTAVSADNGFFNVSVTGDTDMEVSCKRFINCAGLNACEIASNIDRLDQTLVPQPRYAKGNYFRLSGKSPVSRLIYPVPEPGGLGVHITVDMGNQCRFGPDVQWQDTLDCHIDASRANNFYAAIRQYWPDLKDNALEPDYAGIRPKIAFNDELHTDFIVQTRKQHGIDGLINLYGIESPGLTSCLAIADHVIKSI